MATAVGPNIVEDGLVLSVDAGSERSYPRNNLNVSWLDYNSGLANDRYSILNSTQPYDILIKNNYTSWIGSFSHDILSAENYTIMFDYVADADSSLVLDNDGVNDNNWNATIPVTTSVQTYNVTKAVTVTGNIKFYLRRASGGNITISNFRFFKADTVNSLVDTNTGTLTNGTGFSNGNGGVFTFDGSNDYITFGNTQSLKNQAGGTISIWVHPETTSMKFALGWHGNTSNYMRLQVSGNGVTTLLTEVGNVGNSVSSTDTTPLNQWTNIVITQNGTNSKIHINGVLQAGSGNSTWFATHPTLTLYLGSELSWGGYDFNGKISNTLIYSRVLTAAEITQNYNAQKNRFI